jgi:hypothetical protein
MTNIKLEWVTEAFTKTKKRISALNRIIKALPSKECPEVKVIDKKYRSYARGLSAVFTSIGLKAYYEHIGINEALPKEGWPRWDVTVKKHGESGPIATIEIYPTMHRLNNSENAENVQVITDGKEKSFCYKDFKKVIEYPINKYQQN